MSHTCRQFLKQAGATLGALSLGPLAESCARLGSLGHPRLGLSATPRRPNIVLILTDDQGYGDLSCTGNPHLHTPRIDSLRRDGLEFSRFYVCPVCSPTRASLLTGRYNMRTRVIDTYGGRSLMDPAEVTLAEALRGAGYRTGIFGKWHLGDQTPMRPGEQGFEESLVLPGGGLAQPSGPLGNGYFDSILRHNGQPERVHGYCMDAYTDAALRFIDAHRTEPFFVYLATNTPHEPLQVPEEWIAPFRAAGLPETTARLYAMVENIDRNVGRVLDRLNARHLADDTIVVFLSDNGPTDPVPPARYNAGLRGAKGSVYEGGIRVPCFLRWPRRVTSRANVGHIAAHIDLMPTLLAAAGVAPPAGVKLDGQNLWPLIEGHAADWPDRTIFSQWHRGDAPQPYNNCAAITDRYKLVNGKELYDLAADPGEQHDLAAERPEVVGRLRAAYEAWFADVCATRGFDPLPIDLGSPAENPVTLTRQDWRGPEGWTDDQVGWWCVRLARPGRYHVTLRFPASASATAGTVCFALAGERRQVPLPVKTGVIRFTELLLPAGETRLEAWLQPAGQPEATRRGVYQVDVEYVGAE